MLNKYGFKNQNLIEKYPTEKLVEYMKKDKKATSDKITFVVPSEKKKVKIMALTIDEVLKMF